MALASCDELARFEHASARISAASRVHGVESVIETFKIMEITLKPETIQRIGEKVRRGEFDSADAIVEQAVTFFLDYEKDEMDEAEFLDLKWAVAEAQEHGARGEGDSIDEFERIMRARYGIQR